MEHGFGFHPVPFIVGRERTGRGAAGRPGSVPLSRVHQLRPGSDGLCCPLFGRLLGRQQVSCSAHFSPTNRQWTARSAGLLRGFGSLQVSFSRYFSSAFFSDDEFLSTELS